MRPSPLGRVHLVADLDCLDSLPDALERIRALLAAGLDSLQLRAPGRAPEEVLVTGRALRAAARASGAFFAVNGDPGLALALEADGLHLPARAEAPRDVRAHLPPGMAVGASAHDRAELERAAGADWVLVSPVFPTRSKPGAAPLGTAGLSRLAAASEAPVHALGGIEPDRATACLEAGAAGVAAIRGLLEGDGAELIRRVHAWRDRRA